MINKSLTIDSSLFQLLERVGTVQRYAKNELIYLQDEISSRFYLIKSGRVRIFVISKEGVELTIEILILGQLFGDASCYSEAPRLTSASAVTDVEVIGMDFEQLLPYLIADSQTILQLFGMMSYSVYNLANQLKSLAFLPADKRVAQLLVQLGINFKKKNNNSAYTIDYSHEDIALLVGINRVTATKVLNKLVKFGYIQLKYKKIIVIEEQGLKDYSNI